MIPKQLSSVRQRYLKLYVLVKCIRSTVRETYFNYFRCLAVLQCTEVCHGHQDLSVVREKIRVGQSTADDAYFETQLFRNLYLKGGGSRRTRL